MDRKELIREYKQTPRTAGLFVVRNTTNDRVFVGASPDIPGMLNRQRFQLEMGLHPDRELQLDWNAQGPDEFVFEVLDTLKPSEDPSSDLAADLTVLRGVWVDRLRESGASLYPMSARGL